MENEKQPELDQQMQERLVLMHRLFAYAHGLLGRGLKKCIERAGSMLPQDAVFATNWALGMLAEDGYDFLAMGGVPPAVIDDLRKRVAENVRLKRAELAQRGPEPERRIVLLGDTEH